MRQTLNEKLLILMSDQRNGLFQCQTHKLIMGVTGETELYVFCPPYVNGADIRKIRDIKLY